MNLFITGVSGYVGSVLVEQAAKDTSIDRITGIDRVPPSYDLPENMAFEQIDIRDKNLSSLMAGHDAVIHLAYVVLWPASTPAAERDEINVRGVRCVAEAADGAGVSRFIHTSSFAAYDFEEARKSGTVGEDGTLCDNDTISYYARSKAAAERMLAAFMKPRDGVLTILRPHYIIGPRNRDTLQGLRENAVYYRGRRITWQFIHEDDVAEAFLRAAKNDMPGVYNVCPDDSISWEKILEIIGEADARTIPAWVAKILMAYRWHFRGSLVHPSWLDIVFSEFAMSNEKLKATGWRPNYSSREALESAL